jgi:hypothetical protein
MAPNDRDENAAEAAASDAPAAMATRASRRRRAPDPLPGLRPPVRRRVDTPERGIADHNPLAERRRAAALEPEIVDRNPVAGRRPTETRRAQRAHAGGHQPRPADEQWRDQLAYLDVHLQRNFEIAELVVEQLSLDLWLLQSQVPAESAAAATIAGARDQARYLLRTLANIEDSTDAVVGVSRELGNGH